MSDEPVAREREPIDRVRARLEALLKANAAPRCGARSKRTGKPCQGAAMRNGRGCGRQYLRSATCATQSKAPAPFDEDRANLDMRPRPAALGGELAGIVLAGGNPGALGFAAPRRSHE